MCQNQCPQNMNFNELSMHKCTIFELVSNMMFVKKMTSLKNVKPRRPLYSCSRIRVGEVSPREEGTNNFKEILQKTFKDRTRKRGATNMINT